MKKNKKKDVWRCTYRDEEYDTLYHFYSRIKNDQDMRDVCKRLARMYKFPEGHWNITKIKKLRGY
jgi:hypothetical protein